MCNYSSSPRVANSVFRNNASTGTAGGQGGGGMYNTALASPEVVGCTFVGNTARSGGGIYDYNSLPVVRGCVFTGNRATTDNGGGMADEESSSAELVEIVS